MLLPLNFPDRNTSLLGILYAFIVTQYDGVHPNLVTFDGFHHVQSEADTLHEDQI